MGSVVFSPMRERMFFALLLLSSSISASPQIDCFVDKQECDIRPDNLIQTFLGITSIEECRQLCEDEFTCTAFTHFGSDSRPIQDGCLLFSSCKERRACENCTLGTSQTECTCSISYDGLATSDNFVDLVPGVKDEFACKSLCLNESRCDLYTYYDSGDPVQPETCFLLTGLGETVSSCESCHTGPGQCRVNEACQAAVITNNGRATNTIFAEESSTLTLLANEKDCYVDLDVIAIGGGGKGTARGAGAGSGYVETGSIRLHINNPVMEVTVGTSGIPSKVKVGGDVLLEAAPGETNVTCPGACGADGYSLAEVDMVPISMAREAEEDPMEVTEGIPPMIKEERAQALMLDCYQLKSSVSFLERVGYHIHIRGGLVAGVEESL